MSNLICPKCGKSDSEVEFIDSFCIKCFPIKVEFPQSIPLRHCRKCDRMLFRGDWIPYNPKKLAVIILAKCSGNYESADFDSQNNTIIFNFVGGKKLYRVVSIDTDSNQCPRCSRISGGYYQGIVQLRGNEKRISKLAEILFKKLEKLTFISKTEEKDGGIDIYVGSSKAALTIINNMGLDSLITKKLIGREEGTRLYRTTFSIRME